MKNLKNMLTAVAMTAVLGLGTVSANAGLIITDKGANTPKDCSVGTGVLDQIAGIIIVGLNGLIITDRDGLIITDKSECVDKDGLIITDRDGLIITD